MKKITLTDRLRYKFDNIMSRGSIALIGWLFILSAIMILVVSVIVVATGVGPTQDDGVATGFWPMTWVSLMRTMDAGAISGDTGSWQFLLAMFITTIGGIFIFSTLIGILTSGIESKLEELRKGRSFVVEEGHTVILGWSPQIFSIISELVIANANRPHACIVILAEKDKVEMEDEIRGKVGSTGRTRVVCRTGIPIDLTDLEIVNPHGARSIIVLAPTETSDPDSQVIKTILALTHSPQRRAEPYHIVAELREAKSLEVVWMIGRDEVQSILVGDLLSRITVQTCRQSGLSVIYTELLDFSGDEIYFHEEPGLTGRTFGEALFAYEDSALIGLRLKDGRIHLNPPRDTPIQTGDQLIAISTDDDTIRLSGRTDYNLDLNAIREPLPQDQTPVRTIILGWNQRAPAIIKELDYYVPPGSAVMVAANIALSEMESASADVTLSHQTLSFQQGDMTDRRTLNRLEISTYQHVIVLSYSDTLGPQEADALTLITLLHLRDIAEKAGYPFSIVSEMLDVRNRSLAEITQADDFIVSERLISLMLAQVSENKGLAEVFADLFDPEGSELYLRPAGDYVQLKQPLNFYTIIEAAQRRGQIAIGYRLRAEANNAAKAYGVHVNPHKSQMITFSEGDRIIVLTEE
jgi:ion channel POLLUX/CASTOR